MYQFDLFLFMKKSTVMLGAIFGTLLMGCSDEEIANMETSSRNAIGFNVLSNAAETRATPTTPDNLTSTDFDVFAFTADGTAFMGKVDTEFGHDGVKIVYKNGKWDYDDPNELRYWPNEALDFYAFNPTAIVGNMDSHYMWKVTKDEQKIYYSCVDEYGGTHGHENHDVMYAIAKGQTKDTNSGKVKFTFKHILSQVVFKAKTQYDNMQVDINMIKIHNIKFSDTFTLPTAAKGTGSWTSSGPLGKNAYTVVQNENITVKGNDPVTKYYHRYSYAEYTTDADCLDCFRRQQNQGAGRHCVAMLSGDRLQNPAVRSLSVGFSKRIQNNLCSVRRYMGTGQASYLHVDFRWWF